MKIYLAAPWKDRDLARSTASELVRQGHQITREWWDYDAPDHDFETLKQLAYDDMHGVASCDVLVLLDTQKSEGKAFEQGLAVALVKPIIAIGQQGSQSLNIFHHLDNYIWVSSLEAAIEQLNRI